MTKLQTLVEYLEDKGIKKDLLDILLMFMIMIKLINN